MFDLDRALIVFDREGSVQFQLFGEYKTLTYTEFALLSGFSNMDFTNIPQYAASY